MKKEVSAFDLESVLVNLEKVEDLMQLALEESDHLPDDYDPNNSNHKVAVTSFVHRSRISHTLLNTAFDFLGNELKTVRALIS